MLCSGSNFSVPDLRDRFVVGTSASAPLNTQLGVSHHNHAHAAGSNMGAHVQVDWTSTHGNYIATEAVATGFTGNRRVGAGGWVTESTPAFSRSKVSGSTTTETLDNRPPSLALTFIIKY